MKNYLAYLAIVLVFIIAGFAFIFLWPQSNQPTFTADEQQSIQTAEQHNASYIVVVPQQTSSGPVTHTYYYYAGQLPQAMQQAASDTAPYVIQVGSTLQDSKQLPVTK